MTIIVLLAFGLVLLAFALIFRKRHTTGFEQMMTHNQNVQPLLKERSANLKHEQLQDQHKSNPAVLRELNRLQTDYADKLMDAATYERRLDELAAKQKVTR
ncbi:hypothetical protein [Mucilaginibacter myungsuensis]|uniref:Uncharacterized protein n=1 Tax=Mucilaginibacter myungsuensis TaxID=649104 RepID=A0A929KY10_9SPHI|nr:hypothetical protein [Mucilaginibacter myungsuensis]MBE9662003.1 hypothetical protein [Mucilaginibacter myungsuensis]MDN3599564.1 hypothetical protein [Mucilaginibacter myungsuensis]